MDSWVQSSSRTPTGAVHMSNQQHIPNPGLHYSHEWLTYLTAVEEKTQVVG